MPKNEEQQAILKDIRGREVPLVGVKAHARLQGLLAEVEVEQSYRNPRDTNIEAVYTFPLPFSAVLLGLEVEIAGKKLAGQVVEKKEAERRYEDAVTDGDSAVMLEEAGPGLYTASLGNLMAGESAVIRYRYGLLLKWQGDRLRFLLPTTIAPRYGDAEAAGLQPYQVPEAALDVEYPLDLMVDVEGDLATAAIASPSHPIAMERTETGLRIRLDRKAYLDRDFVLTLSSEKVQSSCVVVPDGEGHVTLASLRIPPVPELERQPLALKLVIDCSGSMGGTSIAQARKAGLAILDQLRPEDSFDVTLFGSSYKHFFRTMVPASARYISEAWNMIGRMDADMGGTEMEKALDAVFALKGKDTTGTVLLITDGEIEEHEKLVRNAQKAGQRVFVVGVGNAVADTFLRNLADTTGGACELVAPQEGMGEFVLSQFYRMRQKRLGSMRLDWPTAPKWATKLPDTIFAGDTVHAFASFDKTPLGEARLVIEGKGEAIAAITQGENREIPRIAAARRLDEVPEAEAKDLAVRYQLLSRWTNFLVIAERDDKAEKLPELQKVPQMLAADWGGVGAVCDSLSADFSCSMPLYDRSSARSSRDSRAQSMSSLGMDKYDIPAFLRKQCDDDDATSSSSKRVLRSERLAGPVGAVAGKVADVARKLRSLTSPQLRCYSRTAMDDHSPMAFISNMESALLENLRQPRLPDRIDELSQWNLDSEVLLSLRSLIAKGYDEAEVVAAFVYALTQSTIGGQFGRDLKRAILKVWKRVVPGRDLDRAMHHALKNVSVDAWNWRKDPIELLNVVATETA